MKRFIYHNLLILMILVCFQNCDNFTAMQVEPNSSLKFEQAQTERTPNTDEDLLPVIKELKLIGVNNTHEILLSPNQVIETDDLKDTEYQILAITTESSKLVSFNVNNNNSEADQLPYLSNVMTLESDISLEIKVIAYIDIDKSGPKSLLSEVNIKIIKSDSKPIELEETQLLNLSLKRLNDGKAINLTDKQIIDFDDFGKSDLQIYAEVNDVSQLVQFEVNGVENNEVEPPYTSSVIKLKSDSNYSIKVTVFNNREKTLQGSSVLSLNFKTSVQKNIEPENLLFFGGFENNKPGDTNFKNEWGINWQSFPSTNYEVIDEAKGAFQGKSLQVKYPGKVLGKKQRINYASDLNKLKVGYRDNLYMRYYVKFHSGFEWVLGGKMPGLAGQHDVTGGDPVNGTNGWSTRYMWRKDGELVVYAYLTGKYKHSYGFDMSFVDQQTKKKMKLTTGKWLCLEQYIALNDVGKNNGVIKAWLDGKQGVNVSDATFRTVNNQSTLIGQLLFSTFYGGNSNDWAPSKDTYASYDNFTISDKRIGCD